MKEKGTLYKYIMNLELIPKAEYSGKIKIISIVPNDYKYRQKIKKTIYSLPPSRVFIDNNTKYAEFNFTNINKKTILYIECDFEIFKYDLDTAKKTKGYYKKESQKSLKKYLEEEKYIECNNEKIIEAAKQFKGEEREEVVRQIFDFVASNMQYKVQKKTMGLFML